MPYLIITILLAFSGVLSGLTLSLLGLDKYALKRKIKLGDKNALKIYNIRRNGNLLLTTLLIGNVMVNTILSIFLGSLLKGWLAAILATSLIVTFGEIIPQATFSRYAMTVGSKGAWLVKILIYILYPVTYPLAWILDKILGEEIPNLWSHAELKEIIKEHEDSPDSEIDEDEERIMLGVLSFSNKTAGEIMTSKNKIFGLDKNSKLNLETLNKIKKNGYTRIPIYEKNLDKIIGVLFSKDLIGVNQEVGVEKLARRNKYIAIKENKKLDDLLNMFVKSKAHIAFIYNNERSLIGLVTLENVLEEILRMKIEDEKDKMKDSAVKKKIT